MRTCAIFIVLTVFILTLSGLVSPTATGAEDNTCWFKANGSYDVYFVIREKTADQGDREYVMWQGWVKHYEKKQYVSKTGSVRYDYKTSIDDALVGDNLTECRGGNVINIP